MAEAELDRSALEALIFASEGPIGIAALKLPVSSLAELLEALMAFIRSSGSSMLVERLTSTMVTWLLKSVLPASRRLTGTPAVSERSGVQLQSAR